MFVFLIISPVSFQKTLAISISHSPFPNNCGDMISCLYKVFHLDSYWLSVRLRSAIAAAGQHTEILQAEQERPQIEREIERVSIWYIVDPFPDTFIRRSGPIYPFEC